MADKAEQPLATYTERLPQVRRDFALYADRVEILASWTAGKSHRARVLLADLSPKVTAILVRNRWLKKSIMIGALALACAAVLSRGDYPDFVRRTALLGWPVAALCAGVAVICFPKRRFARFVRKDGKVALDICQAGPDRGRFEEFIKKIQQQIRS